jgi:hypothetical protein
MLGISFSITRQAKRTFNLEALAATDFINILLNRFFSHYIIISDNIVWLAQLHIRNYEFDIQITVHRGIYSYNKTN